MELNFLYPIFVGLHFLNGLANNSNLNGEPEAIIKLPGHVRTEIETRYYVGLITVFLGNPPQKITALMNAQESAFVVLDANCVENALKVQKQCKKYCVDVKFCKIHCHPLCCESPQNIRSFCYNQTPLAYNQTATKPARRPDSNLTNVWSSQYEGYRLQFGEYVEDTVALAGLGTESTLIFMQNLTFVSGLLTDPRLFRINAAVFGFSPRSQNNMLPFVMRMFHSGLIQKPLLSLAYRTYSLNGAMTLGAEEPKYCQQDWIYHQVKEEEWILEADNFTFNGQEYAEKVKLYTQPFSEQLEIPLEIIQPMLDEGTLILYQDEYVVDCDSDLELSFNIDGLDYTVGPTQLIDHDPWEHNGMCVARIRPIEAKRYAQTVDFVLGMPWFFRFCHTFDFQQMRIGLSRVKNDIYA